MTMKAMNYSASVPELTFQGARCAAHSCATEALIKPYPVGLAPPR
jgi:hypothetical protein